MNKLADRARELPPVEHAPLDKRVAVLGELSPPARFSGCLFDNYIPNPDFPSQAQAVERLAAEFPARRAEAPLRRTLPWRRKHEPLVPRALYLDGGFGVGKTHLLASAWHCAPAPKAYVTFSQLVALIGLYGMPRAVAAFSALRLLAIDEFELDDVAQTLMVVSFLRPVIESGVQVVVTSNSLPDRLGEGRFAADDFRREIAAISSHFDVLRVDGPDYRHRETSPSFGALPTGELLERAQEPGATIDDAAAIHAVLRAVHPARLPELLDGVTLVVIRDLAAIDNQGTALLFVQLVDRIYDSGCRLAWSGVDADELFDPSFRHGGYAKKYGRCESRLGELAREGRMALSG